MNMPQQREGNSFVLNIDKSGGDELLLVIRWESDIYLNTISPAATPSYLLKSSQTECGIDTLTQFRKASPPPSEQQQQQNGNNSSSKVERKHEVW